ncbi:MAG: hypothetical protein V4726_19895 [Verrucomicrobiota bacterium]
MTTTTTLPDDFELHEGEEIDFRAVAKNGTLIITQVLRSRAIPHLPERAGALFSEKWGGTMSRSINPEDARLAAINEKHVK